MTGIQHAIVSRLIEEGKYEQALMEANYGEGYWPDERYESARENVRQTLDSILLRERIKEGKK